MHLWRWPVWPPRTACLVTRLTGPSLPAVALTRRQMPMQKPFPAPPSGNWCKTRLRAPLFPPAPLPASSASSRNPKAVRPWWAMSWETWRRARHWACRRTRRFPDHAGWRAPSGCAPLADMPRPTCLGSPLPRLQQPRRWPCRPSADSRRWALPNPAFRRRRIRPGPPAASSPHRPHRMPRRPPC